MIMNTPYPSFYYVSNDSEVTVVGFLKPWLVKVYVVPSVIM